MLDKGHEQYKLWFYQACLSATPSYAICCRSGNFYCYIISLLVQATKIKTQNSTTQAYNSGRGCQPKRLNTVKFSFSKRNSFITKYS